MKCLGDAQQQIAQGEVPGTGGNDQGSDEGSQGALVVATPTGGADDIPSVNPPVPEETQEMPAMETPATPEMKVLPEGEPGSSTTESTPFYNDISTGPEEKKDDTPTMIYPVEYPKGHPNAPATPATPATGKQPEMPSLAGPGKKGGSEAKPGVATVALTPPSPRKARVPVLARLAKVVADPRRAAAKNLCQVMSSPRRAWYLVQVPRARKVQVPRARKLVQVPRAVQAPSREEVDPQDPQEAQALPLAGPRAPSLKRPSKAAERSRKRIMIRTCNSVSLEDQLPRASPVFLLVLREGTSRLLSPSPSTTGQDSLWAAIAAMITASVTLDAVVGSGSVCA